MRAIRYDLKWAQTIDGQLCDDTGSSQWISGPEERFLTHQIRRSYDVIAVGASTYLNDRCQLTVRNGAEMGLSSQPARVIIDPRGALGRCWVEASVQERRVIREDLQGGQRDTYVVGDVSGLAELTGGRLRLVEACLDFSNDQFGVSLSDALSAVPNLRYERELRVLIEGGPRLLTAMIRLNLYDELQVSIAPRLTGGVKHRVTPLFSLANAASFEVVERRFVGEDTFLALKRRNQNDV